MADAWWRTLPGGGRGVADVGWRTRGMEHHHQEVCSWMCARMCGGDVLDKVTGGGATRLRRVWEAFSKDLVPGKRRRRHLGGSSEPRAGTITGWDTPADAADKH